MTNHELYISRTLQLASLANGDTLSNPLVGAILVHQERIIGEGYHKAFGQDHAEINALNAVKDADKHLIKDSILYVNLEPCCIHSKTPPCTDAIIKHKIKKVVVGFKDPNPKINGKGLALLTSYGVEVISGVLVNECIQLNRSFIKNMQSDLPYIILKYATSKDGFIGSKESQIKISNDWSAYLVHKIRHEVDAIMIGTNTAIIDNPSLTNRLYFGKNPIRIVLDQHGRIPLSNNIFSPLTQTIVVGESIKYPDHVQTMPWPSDLTTLFKSFLEKGISKIMIEGGAILLQKCIDENIWDELWCTTGDIHLGSGVPAPKHSLASHWSQHIGNDQLKVFYNSQNLKNL